MKLSTIFGLVGSLYFLYYLEGLMFWIYLVGALIFHLRVALAFARSYDDMETDKKLYLKKWKIGSNFENILFFMIPLLAVFKGWILVDKNKSVAYGENTNLTIILILATCMYSYIEYDLFILLLLFVHLSSTVLFVKYGLKKINLYENNRLIVFTIYTIPTFYILVYLYRFLESSFMYCNKNEA